MFCTMGCMIQGRMLKYSILRPAILHGVCYSGSCRLVTVVQTCLSPDACVEVDVTVATVAFSLESAGSNVVPGLPL